MKLVLRSIACAAVAFSFFALPTANASIITHSSDFIADASRTGFNGFESIPNDGVHYTNGSSPYTEGGITVGQVNGNSGNSIWIGYNFWTGATGNSWYPDGGDHGYTTITLSNGGSFADVGFNVGTGGGASLVVYELFNKGSLILAGTSSLSSHYVGFSGGGFDTIRLRDNYSGSNSNVANGLFQALAIDNVETSGTNVPEPASLALLGLGLVGLGFNRRKKA